MVHPFVDRWNDNSELYPQVAQLVANCKVVLDVGCGDGTLAQYLAGLGHQVIGIDTDPTNFPAASENTHYLLGDAENLQFEAQSFDAVVAVDVLHHGDQALMLAEMKRVLKPDGKIVIVGVAASKTLADYTRDSADTVRRVIKRIGKTRWRPDLVDAQPQLGWRETRQLISRILRGANFQRTGSTRYLAYWPV